MGYGCIFLRLGSGVPGRSRMSRVSGRALLARRIDVCAPSRPFSRKFEQHSATPTMKDEDSRQTRSFVIYWSLHIDVTEMFDESRALGRTCNDDNDALSFNALISSHAEIRWCFAFDHRACSSRINNLGAKHEINGYPSETYVSTIDVLTGNSSEIYELDIWHKNMYFIIKRYVDKFRIYKEMF